MKIVKPWIQVENFDGKQIMKNIERNSKNNIKSSEEKDTFYKFVTSLAGIILVLILCYLIIGIFVTKEINFNKDSKDDNKTSEVTIDNSTITMGQIFEQKEETYYVVVYDVSSKLTNLSTFVSNYKSKEGSNAIYTVDSSKKFNSSYIVTENSNKNPTSYSDLKVISPTLIKIDNKKVTSYIEGEDAIKDVLKN